MTGIHHIEHPNAPRTADPAMNGIACARRAMAFAPTAATTTHARRWTFVDPAGRGTRKPAADLTIGASSGPKTGEGDSGTRKASA